MTIDFSKLSSEELFELARQKQKAEEDEKHRAAAKERMAELQGRRNALTSKHEESLKKADAAIAELQAKRSNLIAEHEEALAALEKEALELERLMQTQAPAAKPAPAAAAAPAQARPVAEDKPAAVAKPAPAPAPAPAAKPAAEEPAAAKPAAAQKINTTDDLFVHIREMMLGRSYISESLVRDKLMSKGISVSGLHKLFDQLVREQRLSSKGGGNYALGRKA